MTNAPMCIGAMTPDARFPASGRKASNAQTTGFAAKAEKIIRPRARYGTEPALSKGLLPLHPCESTTAQERKWRAHDIPPLSVPNYH